MIVRVVKRGRESNGNLSPNNYECENRIGCRGKNRKRKGNWKERLAKKRRMEQTPSGAMTIQLKNLPFFGGSFLFSWSLLLSRCLLFGSSLFLGRRFLLSRCFFLRSLFLSGQCTHPLSELMRREVAVMTHHCTW